MHTNGKTNEDVSEVVIVEPASIPVVKKQKRFDWRSPYAICTATVNHIIQGVCLSVFYIFQCIILDLYILNHFRLYFIIYFFSIADALCLALFIYALHHSHTYMKKYTEDCHEEHIEAGAQRKPIFGSLSGKVAKIKGAIEMSRYNPLHELYIRNSVMPFIYISWITYIGILSAKITLIFKSSLPDILRLDNVFFGPQTLKLSIGLASLVFLFLAEGHNWEHMQHPRNRYTKTLCAQIVIDIFDSVSLLSIIMDGPDKEHLLVIENLIIALANFNLLLPAMKLYKLSLVELVPTKTEQILVVVHALAYAFIINGSFLGIRIHIWFYDGEDPSIYLMKNIISIILAVWQVYPAIVLLQRKEVAEII